VSATVTAPGGARTPVLSVRRNCLDPVSEAVCTPAGDANLAGGAGAPVDLEAGTYYVLVDGDGPLQQGAFQLGVNVDPVGDDNYAASGP
jgi:hypothetical protein